MVGFETAREQLFVLQPSSKDIVVELDLFSMRHDFVLCQVQQPVSLIRALINLNIVAQQL